MTRKQDETPTIREHTITDTRKGGEDPVVSQYIEPQEIGRVFQEYRLIRQLPAAGGEADIWIIQRGTTYNILKLYRLGIEPNHEVLKKVSKITKTIPQNIVKILSFGYDEETTRWFEIQEYARDGSLKDLIRDHQVGIGQLKTIIKNIAAGLDTLHQSGILHLDLKPSNILIRNLQPLILILTDFGISSLLDTEHSRQITSTKGTPMYWAPEQLGNVVGKEADFWALGVIALEIIQHKHPFDGMNHHVILSTLSTQGIRVPPDIQPKTALLLKGLLTRNPKKRWGIKEVSKWLAGNQNIPVFFESGQVSGTGQKSPYEFENNQYVSLPDLCSAFIQNPDSWGNAKRHIGRGYLTRWLEKNELYTQAVEIEKCAENYPDEDERLLFLIARFNPEIPFTFLGKSLDVAGITHHLGRYFRHQNDEPEKKIISMLFSGDLNRIYQTYFELTGNIHDSSQVTHMFSWLASNSRGTDEKNRLYEFLTILKEREEIGSPHEWDAGTMVKMIEVYDQFLKQGYDHEAARVVEDIRTACIQALKTETNIPDFLVALASSSEEVGLKEYVSPCLKKASETDIRVISLIFSKKKGADRFRLYQRLKTEYETTLYSLASDPWNEPEEFWIKIFFREANRKDSHIALSVSERLIEMNKTGPEGWAMRGVILAKMGRLREAEFFLSQPVVQLSNNPLIWQIIGEYQAGSGKFDEAEASYQKGLIAQKNHPGSVSGLMKLYASQKKYHQIIELGNMDLVTSPGNQELLLQKGDAYFALGRIQEAVRTYEQYLMISPSDTRARKSLVRCLIKLKRNDDAEKSVNLLLENGSRDPQVFRLMAYLLLTAGKIREAIRYLDMTLQIQTTDLWSLRIKIDAQISLNAYGPALACIDILLTQDPENYQFIEKKGKILLSLGFYSAAVEALKQAIDGGRFSADLFVQYGDALRQKQNDRYGNFQQIPNIADKNLQWRVTHLYGDLWKKSGITQEEITTLMKASEWYDKSLPLGSDDGVIRNRKGIIACMLGDYDQAESLFTEVKLIQDQEPAHLSNLASVYILQGKVKKGLTLFLQGINKFSQIPAFLDQAAGMYYYIKDYENALNLITQAVAVNNPPDPGILYHQYQIMTILGQITKAQDVLATIKGIDPWFVIDGEKTGFGISFH